MHISTHNVDDLNARVVINLAPSDYQPLVEQKIKEHAKKVKVPGFRPGKVPAGMVKKMYGTSILIDEVNNMLSRKVYEYIQEEKLNILGSPLPSASAKSQADWDNPKEMEFTYDLGSGPGHQCEVGQQHFVHSVCYPPNDKDIESALDNLSRRNGEMTEVEAIGDTDLVKVQWVELNADGSVKEGGVLHSSSISMDAVDEASKAGLLGLKVGDSAVVDHTAFSKNDTDRAAMLGVKKEELDTINPDFKITVERIQCLVPAELNEELFKRMYPDGSVTDIEGVKEKIREDYTNYFSKESDRKLKNDIILHLLQELNIALPDAFLKRWLVVTNENKFTAEQIENEYVNYANSLKWQLIENTIIRENQLLVSNAELREGAFNHLKQQFAAYGLPLTDSEMVKEMVESFMKREDEVRRLNEELYDQKVMQLCKERFKLNEKVVNSEEFYAAAAEGNN
jgi:trigger factor